MSALITDNNSPSPRWRDIRRIISNVITLRLRNARCARKAGIWSLIWNQSANFLAEILRLFVARGCAKACPVSPKNQAPFLLFGEIAAKRCGESNHSEMRSIRLMRPNALVFLVNEPMPSKRSHAVTANRGHEAKRYQSSG